MLEAEETVSQALRRLKGGRSDKKRNMTEEAMELFHQLTNDATNLVHYYGGVCNVYHLKKEEFLEEAKVHQDSLTLKKQFSLETGELLHSDYVYDPSTGYYYHASSGYYYNPSSGLYCYAGTGQWYLYNEQTGGYKAV